MLDNIVMIVLGMAALGGATAATLHLSRRYVPLWVGLAHGSLAAPGLVLLFITVATEHGFRSTLGAALGLFLLAAIGGAILFARHAKRQNLPPLLILAHGATAVTAYVVLLFAAL